MLDMNVIIDDKAGGGIVVIIIVTVIGLLMSLGSTKNNIVGIWERTDTKMLYEFTEDGCIYLNGSNYGSITFTSTNDENRIEIDIDILWSHTRLFADVDYFENTITLSNFTDPDGLFGVGNNDTWVFTKIF